VTKGYKNETVQIKNIVHATIINACSGKFIESAAAWIMNVELA
jgi:hypothetical protein